MIKLLSKSILLQQFMWRMLEVWKRDGSRSKLTRRRRRNVCSQKWWRMQRRRPGGSTRKQTNCQLHADKEKSRIICNLHSLSWSLQYLIAGYGLLPIIQPTCCSTGGFLLYFVFRFFGYTRVIQNISWSRNTILLQLIAVPVAVWVVIPYNLSWAWQAI